MDDNKLSKQTKMSFTSSYREFSRRSVRLRLVALPPVAPSVTGIDLSLLRNSHPELSARPSVVRKVLLVEDEMYIRTTMKRAIGRTVNLTITNPNIDDNFAHKVDALLKVGQAQGEGTPYDCIIVDGLYRHGAILIQELRQNGFQGWIVAFSTNPDEIKSMVNAGADWFVHKTDEASQQFPSLTNPTQIALRISETRGAHRS